MQCLPAMKASLKETKGLLHATTHSNPSACYKLRNKKVDNWAVILKQSVRSLDCRHFQFGLIPNYITFANIFQHYEKIQTYIF